MNILGTTLIISHNTYKEITHYAIRKAETVDNTRSLSLTFVSVHAQHFIFDRVCGVGIDLAITFKKKFILPFAKITTVRILGI